MPKIQINPTQVFDHQGNPLTSIDISLYRILDEGAYIAKITAWGYEEFTSTKSGKRYAKITPRFQVVNAGEPAIVNTSDFLLYELNDDGTPNPPKGSPMWLGASKAFIAAGLATMNDGVFTMEGDTDTDVGMYVEIVIKHADYTNTSGEKRKKNKVEWVNALSEAKVKAYNESQEDPALHISLSGNQWFDNTNPTAGLI